MGKERVATGQEGEKDPKRVCVVTAEGCEVIGPGYSEMSGIARSVTAKGLGVSSHSQQPDNPKRVARISGGRNSEGSSGTAVVKVGRKPAPQWCPRGIRKTQRRRLQKLCQKELGEKRDDEEHDRWFNHARPMMKVKKTRQEKRLAREENNSNSDSSNKERAKEELVNTEGIDEKL
jgi:hypothetical protein